MSRKAIIVFVITMLFTAMVVGFSWIYLSQLLRQRLLWADETASGLTRQMEYTASKAVPDLTSTRVDTANPKALRAAITGYLQTDANLNDMLESVVGNSQIVYDAAIVDTFGVSILDTNPALNGKAVPQRPALREHKEDIRDLVKQLLAEMSQKHDRKVADVSEAVLNLFQSYSWPGNVRELRNTLERAVIVCEGGLIETKHLPPGFGQSTRPVVHDPDALQVGVGTTVEEAERLLILKTLQSTNNNKTRAAEILGISLKTLHNKLKEYGRPQDAVLAEE